MTYDVGPNVFHLGLLFLLFKYILPIVFVLVFLLGLFLLVRYAIGKLGDVDRNVAIVVVCFILILLVILAA
jgi:hypothetical protein